MAKSEQTAVPVLNEEADLRAQLEAAQNLCENQKQRIENLTQSASKLIEQEEAVHQFVRQQLTAITAAVNAIALAFEKGVK